jgi:transposase
LLAQLLENGRFVYSAVPALEIKQSIGMTRGKNDQVDAERIAFYAAANSYKLKETKLPGKQLLRVKHLLTYRSQLVKISQQLQNTRKSTLIAGKSMDLKTRK